MSAYKPLNVTLAGSSLMIVPPVAPRKIDISAWATGTAYSYGAIVSNAGLLYWCVGAGTSGATAPTHADGDASDGGATWRRVRPIRNRLTIVNDSSAVTYLGIGFAAEANKGIRLNALGGSMSWDERPPQGAIYAIGTGVVTIQEE